MFQSHTRNLSVVFHTKFHIQVSLFALLLIKLTLQTKFLEEADLWLTRGTFCFHYMLFRNPYKYS
jgi:hypothetical protein